MMFLQHVIVLKGAVSLLEKRARALAVSENRIAMKRTIGVDEFGMP